ncbi:MAG: adenylyl-sulfate kinase [candidate division Zixibacteria bacterium]|nr:adenylyl-sulfate kinase [candidate division Zixibacteria bacterium]
MLLSILYNFCLLLKENGESMMIKSPWTIWITGLSGSGKTTICKELRKIMENHGIKFDILRLDEVRQVITPNPQFTDSEKNMVYFSCGFIANKLNEHGINVILDSVDGKGEGRDVARKIIHNFYVISIDCPLEVCIQREKERVDKAAIENLYERALMGQIRIAGVGYPYAEEDNPILKVSSSELSAEQAAQKIFDDVISKAR